MTNQLARGGAEMVINQVERRVQPNQAHSGQVDHYYRPLVNDSPQVREAMTEAGVAAFVSKEAAANQLYDAIADLTKR
jgi:hypothetical protein